MQFLKALGRPFLPRRFKPLDLAIAILLAGWVPSILMAVVSYSILSSTLDSKIIVDRSTLVRALSYLLGYDIVRTGNVMEYYQTQPQTARYSRLNPGDPQTQNWLNESFFPMGWIDGMFLTDGQGRLLAASPLKPELIGRNYLPDELKAGAERPGGGFFVSAARQRLEDGRFVTSVLVAIRAGTGETIGYMGADVLVERIGRRLSNLKLGEQSIAQVVDQSGQPLFDENFLPNAKLATSSDDELFQRIKRELNGFFHLGPNLYVTAPIDGTTWTAVLEQPLAVAYRPVHDLLTRTVALAAWLVVGTVVAAFVVSRLYRRQLDADVRIARATLFNEKILANMPLGIALVDPETQQFVQTNDAFIAMARRFTGLSATADITQTRFSQVPLGLDSMFGHVAGFGTPFHSSERKVVAPDGSVHFLTINLLRLQDEQQRVQGVLFLMEDNTADVTTRQALIAANTAKDQFLALLSHELRNPLSPVITMVAELERQAGELAEFQEPLEIIRRNVELEARLIDDLLDITRITNNKLQLNKQTIDVHQIVRRAVEICQQDIVEKQLKVVVELEATRHHSHADPARLQQVFWNIIKNSVKFTAKGSITIRSANRDGTVVLSVQDTGIGIAPDRLSGVFNAFEQGGVEITRQFGGLGLGLAISRAMILSHEGDIYATSGGEGAGSTFTVELPTVEADVAPTEPARPSAPTTQVNQNRGHRVLLVDDHLDTCRGMRMLLERRGFAVEVAHTVAQAADIGENGTFDLLISDLGLPDGTGYDLMERLRTRPKLRGVALSGFGMESDIERSRQAGFVEHLIKPINVERLDELLRQMFP